VTGWYVENVHWKGSPLRGPAEGRRDVQGNSAQALSADGAYTESLTLSQAHLPDIIVADLMQSANLTSDHGGPVRLYVAPMYGYKSIKWLNRIEVTNEIVPGYWEDNGYPVDAWINGVPER